MTDAKETARLNREYTGLTIAALPTPPQTACETLLKPRPASCIPAAFKRTRDNHATDDANGKHDQPAAIQQAVLVSEDSRRHGHMHAPCDVASPTERIAQQHHRAEHGDERDKA